MGIEEFVLNSSCMSLEGSINGNSSSTIMESKSPDWTALRAIIPF